MTATKQTAIHINMINYTFPRQKVICDEQPFSHELLHSLLEKVYVAIPHFTGYVKITGDESSLYFLFFLNGSPYAAGRYMDGKPVSYSIQELGRHLVSSADRIMSITLCETDPVMLKCMLLFLQEEPDVKAPTSLIDIDNIVRQIRTAISQNPHETLSPLIYPPISSVLYRCYAKFPILINDLFM